MTNYKEILRLHSLGINNTRIAESCGCARSTVIAALQLHSTRDLQTMSLFVFAKLILPDPPSSIWHTLFTALFDAY